MENTLSLGDRMKWYEKQHDFSFTGNMFIIRLDGSTFSKRTKQWKLKKPFDNDFHYAMVDTCKELMQLVPCAKLIWTGSDEISIVCVGTGRERDEWFGNRFNKLLSLTASYASVHFNKFMTASGFDMIKYPAFFDARIIIVPEMSELMNNILSRYNDCKKNSISMWADTLYSHKELLNKNSGDKILMMNEKGLDWENAHNVFAWTKYGTFIYKETICYNANKEKVATGKDAINLFELTKDTGTYIRNEICSMDLTRDPKCISAMFSKIYDFKLN